MCVCLQLCLEFTVCEGLTLASDMKDSNTVDALAVTDTGLPVTVESGYRKSSLPESTQKPSKPPVPVFRKRTSTGNCLVSDATATIREHSTDSKTTDVIDSSQHDSKSGHKSPVKSMAADSVTTLSEDMSAESQSVSASSCRQQATPTPSLLSAVLATSAASIAMITIQGPSSNHSSTVKQKNGDYRSSFLYYHYTYIAGKCWWSKNLLLLPLLCAILLPVELH